MGRNQNLVRLEKINKAPMAFISIKTGDAQLGKVTLAISAIRRCMQKQMKNL